MSAVTPADTSTGARRSAGHLIVRQLEAQGVERVYCVPGESYLDVLDGLHDSPVRTVVCRQEGGAGWMALAEARLTGRPGVAMVTRGPGAANAMIAVHTAYQDRTPLVLFSGLIPTEQRGREAFQEFDIAAWFGSTAKKVLIVDDPDSAARIVADAFHTAASGRPGPVVVGLPEERLLELTASPVAPPRPVAAPAPSPADIAEVEAAIAAASRPVVVVGGEGWTPEAGAALAAWARSHGAGIVADFRAHDIVDHRSETFLGPLGYSSFAGTREAFDAADLQLYLGGVRSDVMSASYTIGTAPARTVVVGPDPDAHGHFGPLDALITADVNDFVAALAVGLEQGSSAEASVPASTGGSAEAGTTASSAGSAGAAGSAGPAAGSVPEAVSAGSPGSASDAWFAPFRARYEEWRTTVTGGERSPEFLDRDRAYREAADVLPEEFVLAYGAGNYSAWALRYWPLTAGCRVLAPKNGAMGMGTPAAVAAALARPEVPVIALAGDGCFMMNGQEFATAVHEGANITVIVDDNSVYGTIVGHQEREYPGRPSGTSMTNPDFAAWAEACGGRGFSVATAEDFAPALTEALAHPGPALLHIRTDPDVRLPRV
ncbi:thiamine pyrophosphate-dependent enzyme [Brevibacterium album]|uniref:thiamine pyrophosphate-dependent enzyme n=1 Tax=Brevibacterium album TaxID=417948 RepID=UPI00040DA5FB|nr:thiamine pyrophosphate-dependent enzyme [Brevibacterium album]